MLILLVQSIKVGMVRVDEDSNGGNVGQFFWDSVSGNDLNLMFENWDSLCFIRIKVSNRNLIFKYLDNEVMGKESDLTI